MAIANMSRYFGVDYYQGLILCSKAIKEKIEANAAEAVRRNKMIRDTSFSCSDASHTLPGEQGFSLWTIYPGLMMGTGYPHDGGLKGDICAGFSFDYVTGLPYLPGSSVKGVLRSAFEHPAYIQELLEDETAKVSALERALFGERQKDAKRMPKDGKVTFLDVFPVGSCDLDDDSKPDKPRYMLLEMEAITPHHMGEMGLLSEPNPLTFLKLRPGVELRFRFLCPTTVRYGEDKSIGASAVLELFKAILLDLGAGAKTNVGFGCLADEKPYASKAVIREVPDDSSRPQATEGICRHCGHPTKKDAKGAHCPYCFECNQKLTKKQKR